MNTCWFSPKLAMSSAVNGGSSLNSKTERQHHAMLIDFHVAFSAPRQPFIYWHAMPHLICTVFHPSKIQMCLSCKNLRVRHCNWMATVWDSLPHPKAISWWLLLDISRHALRFFKISQVNMGFLPPLKYDDEHLMCSHIWATLIWCIVCVSLKKNWSRSWRSKPQFQSIADCCLSWPPVPQSPGSNCLALLAVYRWVSDLCDLGHYGALGFSTWVETMSCLTMVSSKCPPKNPVGVLVLVRQYVIAQFFSEYLDSIFWAFHKESHMSRLHSAVMCFTNGLGNVGGCRYFIHPQCLDCMAGSPSLVLPDSNLNTIAIWGCFKFALDLLKTIDFKRLSGKTQWILKVRKFERHPVTHLVLRLKGGTSDWWTGQGKAP